MAAGPRPQRLSGRRVQWPSLRGPAPWEPQHLAQVRQALLSPGPEAWIKGLNLGLRQGLAGFWREGGLVGKEAVVGGQGLWEEL